MNNEQSQALYENFNSQLSVIEQDMAEIAQMAATVSDKFNGLGENIQNFAAMARLGRKGHAAAHIIGGAVKFLGDVYAELKKEDALKKLLPKKVEIAEAKAGAIQNYRGILESQKEKYQSLLNQEIAVEFTEETRTEYQELHAEAAQNSYSIYVRSLYILEICQYMLAEFDAWKMGMHESGSTKPDKAVVLEEVVAMITTPESLCDPNNTKLTGGIYLLSKNEPLFATILNKIHVNATTNEKKKAKRVADRRSFSEVKNFIRQLKKMERSKDITHLDWLFALPTFHQAVKSYKLTPLFLYLLKYYSILYFLLFLFNSSSYEYDRLEAISTSIIPSLALAVVAVIISLLIFQIHENEDAGRGLWYYIFFLTFTVLTFGLMPFAFNRYLTKESNYEDFLIQLKVKINE